MNNFLLGLGTGIIIAATVIQLFDLWVSNYLYRDIRKEIERDASA